MSGSDNEARRESAGAAGLALLLGSGMAEALAAVEATLANVQSAAAQAFAGLPRVQAAGAAAAAVPPAPTSLRPAAPLPEPVAMAQDAVLPAGRFASPPPAPPTGVEQVAVFAPVFVPGGASASKMVATPAPPAAAASMFFASFAPATTIQGGGASEGGAGVLGLLPNVSAAPVVSEPWAPTAGSSPGQAVARATAAEPARAYAPPSLQGGQSGPTGGDVYLDGMRVGTWLADHLAREVSRPQAGGTSFDPRLTPAWPGTLQGG